MPRRTRWIDALISIDVSSGGQNTQTLFPGITPDELRNGTIVRTVTSLSLTSVSVAGAWGFQILDLGLGVISQEAIGAGIFPDPNDADDYPTRGWLYRERCGVSQNGTGASLLSYCVFDVRSQRKLDTGAYYMVVNNTPGVGTSFTTRVFGSVRTLVLMP